MLNSADSTGKGSYRFCPMCGLDNRNGRDSVYSQAGWIIKKCTRCSFVYLENPPLYEELQKTFAWEETSHHVSEEKKREFWFRRAIRRVERYKDNLLKRDKVIALINLYFDIGPVIDIGCGGGEVMARMNHQYRPYGIEISKYLAQKAQSVAEARGGRVICDNAPAGLTNFERNFFTGAIMSAFLEHEAAPCEALTMSREVLRPGGYLIVKVPNYACINRVIMGRKWCGFRYPDHVSYWTPKTLRKALADTGFEIVQFNIWDRFPTSDNMWLVCRKPTGTATFLNPVKDVAVSDSRAQ